MAGDTPASAKKLSNRRAATKAKITNQFKLMDADQSAENIKNCKVIIEDLLSDITNFDGAICDILSELCSETFIPEDVAEELNRQSSYMTEVRNRLSKYTVVTTKTPDAVGTATDCKLKLPELKCDNFSGEGTTY